MKKIIFTLLSLFVIVAFCLAFRFRQPIAVAYLVLRHERCGDLRDLENAKAYLDALLMHGPAGATVARRFALRGWSRPVSTRTAELVSQASAAFAGVNANELVDILGKPDATDFFHYMDDELVYFGQVVPVRNREYAASMGAPTDGRTDVHLRLESPDRNTVRNICSLPKLGRDGKWYGMTR